MKPSDSNPDFFGKDQPLSSDQTVAAAQQVLQQGLAALKVRDYDTALAFFQQIEHTSPMFRTKAQMGMVQVYRYRGQVDLARKSCQGLLLSPSSKVRQWAQQTLGKLPEAEPEMDAGASDQAPSVAALADQSGFVPLSVSESDGKDSTPPPLSASVAGVTGPTNLGLRFSAATPETLLTEAPEDSSCQSLFHYQRLNQQPLTTAGELNPASVKTLIPDVSSGTVQQAVARPAEGGPSAPVRPGGRPQPPGSRVDRPYRLWAIQGMTAIAILWVLHWGLHQGLKLINAAIRFIQWPIQLRGLAFFDQPHLGLVVGGGILITLASPWIFDLWLTWTYDQKPLSSRQLQAHGGAVLGLLRQVCRQRSWQMPELRVIPEAGPLCFSYGWSPRTARIVVSQDLLETLSEDELTALYAYELAHIANGDMPVLSGLSCLLLLFYSGSRLLAQWGEQKPQPWIRGVLGLLASGLYGIFWLLRKLGLWLSRVRTNYCDQVSQEFSHRPGHHQQLLMTLTRQITQQVDQRGDFHPLITSLDLLMPLSPNQAISPGSFVDRVGLPGLFAEDCLNPYRYWLVANTSHAMLGERLLRLEQWATYRGQPSLGLTLEQLAAANEGRLPSQLTVRDLMLQNSPILGLLIGGGIALGLWFIGGVVNRLNWQQVSWIYQDASVLKGGLLIGLGMGILLRVNALFPELSKSRSPNRDATQMMFHRQPTLPVKGQPITVEGTLLGPSGGANYLGQNLYLKQQEGIVHLKATSPADWWRGFRRVKCHPAHWIGCPATVMGWQRRGGGRLWIDVAAVQISGKPVYQVQSPLWTTGLGIALCLWGVWLILMGG